MNRLQSIKRVADDIKAIKIQWATNIAKSGINMLGNELRKQKFKNLKELDAFFKQAVALLKDARDTEPMLFNWLKMCVSTYKSLITSKADIKTLQNKLFKTCKNYIQDIETEEALRPLIGAKLIKKWFAIMTHCHSTSVINILKEAHKQGKKIHVYNTETRPLFQWKKTSMDLLKAGISDTMIVDWAAPFFVDNLYESDVHIDAVIIGSDAIKINGDVYNKIWSFAIALSAWHSKIPVYIAGSLLKVDTENSVKIEQRSAKEIRLDAPKWINFVNYAFDMIPAKFITGIITEYGIIKPKDIKKYVKKYYPRMMA